MSRVYRHQVQSAQPVNLHGWAAPTSRPATEPIQTRPTHTIATTAVKLPEDADEKERNVARAIEEKKRTVAFLKRRDEARIERERNEIVPRIEYPSSAPRQIEYREEPRRIEYPAAPRQIEHRKALPLAPPPLPRRIEYRQEPLPLAAPPVPRRIEYREEPLPTPPPVPRRIEYREEPLPTPPPPLPRRIEYRQEPLPTPPPLPRRIEHRHKQNRRQSLLNRANVLVDEPKSIERRGGGDVRASIDAYSKMKEQSEAEEAAFMARRSAEANDARERQLAEANDARERRAAEQRVERERQASEAKALKKQKEENDQLLRASRAAESRRSAAVRAASAYAEVRRRQAAAAARKLEEEDAGLAVRRPANVVDEAGVRERKNVRDCRKTELRFHEKYASFNYASDLGRTNLDGFKDLQKCYAENTIENEYCRHGDGSDCKKPWTDVDFENAELWVSNKTKKDAEEVLVAFRFPGDDFVCEVVVGRVDYIVNGVRGFRTVAKDQWRESEFKKLRNDEWSTYVRQAVGRAVKRTKSLSWWDRMREHPLFKS